MIDRKSLYNRARDRSIETLLAKIDEYFKVGMDNYQGSWEVELIIKDENKLPENYCGHVVIEEDRHLIIALERAYERATRR